VTKTFALPMRVLLVAFVMSVSCMITVGPAHAVPIAQALTALSSALEETSARVFEPIFFQNSGFDCELSGAPTELISLTARGLTRLSGGRYADRP
jgi:hypothetical protein